MKGEKGHTYTIQKKVKVSCWCEIFEYLSARFVLYFFYKHQKKLLLTLVEGEKLMEKKGVKPGYLKGSTINHKSWSMLLVRCQHT